MTNIFVTSLFDDIDYLLDEFKVPADVANQDSVALNAYIKTLSPEQKAELKAILRKLNTVISDDIEQLDNLKARLLSRIYVIKTDTNDTQKELNDLLIALNLYLNLQNPLVSNSYTLTDISAEGTEMITDDQTKYVHQQYRVANMELKISEIDVLKDYDNRMMQFIQVVIDKL